MPSRRRPSRFPRRVRRLARALLPRARRHVENQPRPTLERVVGRAAMLLATTERLPSSAEAVRIVLESILSVPRHTNLEQVTSEIINEPPPPVNIIDVNNEEEVRATPREEVIVEISSDEELPSLEELLQPPAPIQNSIQERDPCSVCWDKPQQCSILPCAHKYCGTCPAEVFQRDPRCPLCRRRFVNVAPLVGVPETAIIPLHPPIRTNQTNQIQPINTRNILDNFSPPNAHNLVQCRACGASVNNTPSRVLRHFRGCPRTLGQHLD